MSSHIVIPGQIIATTNLNDEENSFLRGHGTYLENVNDEDSPTSNIQTLNNSSRNNNNGDDDDDDDDQGEQQQQMQSMNQHLIASKTGTILRTNKLIQVSSPNSPYTPHTGDPIVGRVSSISSQKWTVSLNLLSNSTTVNASLPLTGINMPDGMQRIRTNADALTMRTVLSEGDLISAEVREVKSGGSGIGMGNVVLHARSVRCGKLENGCFVMVPSWLIGRMKKQFVVLGVGKVGFDDVKVEVLLGCNGGVWIQLAMMELDSSSSGSEGMVQEEVQRIRSVHARKEMTLEERVVVARVRNAIEALKMVYCRVTPENIEAVVGASAEMGYDVADMLRQDAIAKITGCTRIKK